MYTFTRQKAAEILGISTRSIDRYIKAGKIRSKKVGRVVMLNEEDIKILSGDYSVKQKIIEDNSDFNKKNIENNFNNDNNSNEKFIDYNNLKTNNISQKEEKTDIVKKADYDKLLITFEKMYTGFREEVKQKDEKIQELSVELGILKEQKENSIELIEYKKAQFLNEETRKQLNKKLQKEFIEKEKIKKELKYEKTTNKFLIAFLIILFIIVAVLFYYMK